MKVKILMSMAGSGFSYQKNQTIDIDDAEGARLCKAGRAEPVKQKKQKAIKGKSETATL